MTKANYVNTWSCQIIKKEKYLYIICQSLKQKYDQWVRKQIPKIKYINILQLLVNMG